MTPDLELEIRKEYSRIYPQLNSLELWAKNTFNELSLHENLIYAFNARIKTIDSLLEKIDSKIIPNFEKEAANLNASNLLDSIDDFLGARIMTLVPGKLPDLHDLLLRMSRLEVKMITLHYPKNQQHRIGSFRLPSSCPHELKDNIGGYFGIHYIFSPKPIDEYYENSNCRLFDRFELQLRTLMQHAWSEVQHKVIYKSNKPNYNKPLDGQFSQLARIIHSCDECLSDLTYKPTPTHTTPIAKGQAYFDLTNKIQLTIKDWETKNELVSKREVDTQRLNIEFEAQIKELLAGETNNDTFTPKAELAELYLKSGYEEDAYNIYKSVVKYGIREGWVLLRIAETCSFLLRDEEALDNLKLLKEYLEAKDLTKEQSTLYVGSAMLAWKLNKFDYAVFFGERAILISNDKSGEIRDNLNLIYYKLELLNQLPEKIDIDEIKNLEINAQRALSLFDETNPLLALTSAKCDTLMYFYATWAKLELQRGNISVAKPLVQKATEFLQKFYEKTPPSEQSSKEYWRDHALEITGLMSQVGTLQ